MFAIVELAHRSRRRGARASVSRPRRRRAGTRSGARRSTRRVQARSREIAAALPPVAADAFDGDRDATVHDLYPVVVDQIARDRLARRSRRLVGQLPRPPVGARALRRRAHRAPSAAAAALRLRGAASGSCRAGCTTGSARSRAARRRRGSSACTSTSGRPATRRSSCSSCGCRRRTTRRSACRRRSCGRAATTSSRSCARAIRAGDLIRQLAELEPLLAEHGIRLRRRGGDRGDARRRRRAASSCARRCRSSRSSGVPVLLPAAWVRAPSRLRVNLTATSRRDPTVRSSGLLSTRGALRRSTGGSPSATSSLSEEELAELAKAKDPFVRVGGRWHALRRSEVERALRFLERRRSGSGIVDLVRAVSGLETDEAGLELGEVTLDESLDASCSATTTGASARCRRRRRWRFSCSRSRSAATAGCGCSAISASARSWPTTWVSARRCRRSRCSPPSARRSARTRSARRSSCAR